MLPSPSPTGQHSLASETNVTQCLHLSYTVVITTQLLNRSLEVLIFLHDHMQNLQKEPQVLGMPLDHAW